MEKIQSLDILGVRVHRLTMRETLEHLETMASGDSSHHVVTVNPEFVMTARSNSAFRDVLNSADLALPDGAGIVWASRLLGLTIRERVTGVDVIEQFAPVAARRKLRLFLLGSAPGVAERTAAVLVERSPNLIIAGTFSGSPRVEDEEEICQIIENARPHVLLVAYGAPKQDLWIERTRKRLKVPLSMGVGGSFDYISGEVVRAPLWARRVGLEWLYRLTRQPSRWQRMLALPRFAVLVLVQMCSARTRALLGGGVVKGQSQTV